MSDKHKQAKTDKLFLISLALGLPAVLIGYFTIFGAAFSLYGYVYGIYTYVLHSNKNREAYDRVNAQYGMVLAICFLFIALLTIIAHLPSWLT